MTEILFPGASLLVLAANCIALVVCFRATRRRTLAFAGMIVLILCVSMPLYQRWQHGPLLARVLPRGLLFLPSLFLLQRGQLPLKLYFVASILTVTYLIPIWGTFLGSAVAGADEALYARVSLALIVFMLGVYLALMIRYGRRLYDQMFANERPRTWYLYSAYPIAALYVLSNLFDAIPPSFEWLRQTSLGVYVALTLFIFAGFVLLCAAILTAHNKAVLDYELRLVKDMLNYGRDYYELLAERQEELRVMRHDYRHHLNTLRGLINKNENRVAETYLTELTLQYDDRDSPVYSNNPVVDALIGSVEVRCSAQGIAFETAIELPDDMVLQNQALCIVMGNLLENALEACEAMPKDRPRYIRLNVKRKGAQLALRVENTFDGFVKLDGERVLSRKPDGGTGLRSIRLIAERLGGGYHIQWDGGVFHAYVLLNI